MEGSKIYGMFHENNHSNSTWVPSSTSPSFHETMVNFDQDCHQGRKSATKRDHIDIGLDSNIDDFELNSYQSEKKRRLTIEQVQFLERSFETENKLEPDRKMELANKIGLQPRQVAIWFQNRRARYKTKQLEKEYGSLKANYDQLKLDFDSLSKERDNLQNEVEVLTEKLKQRGDKTTTIFDMSTMTPKMEIVKNDKTTAFAVLGNTNNKQLFVEDASSAKSDVFDSESPHCTDGNHSSLMDDPADQQSDFSPSLTPVYNNFLKVEDIGGFDPNEQPFWSMLY